MTGMTPTGAGPPTAERRPPDDAGDGVQMDAATKQHDKNTVTDPGEDVAQPRHLTSVSP